MKKIILMILCAMMLIVASCSPEPDNTSPSRPDDWDGTIARPDAVPPIPGSGIIDPGTVVSVDDAAELAYIGHTVNGTLRRSESYTETFRHYDVEPDTNKTDWQKAQDAQTLKGVKIVLTQDINLFNNDGTLFPMIGRLLRTTEGNNAGRNEQGGVPNTIVGAPGATEQTPKYTARAGTPFAGKFDGGGKTIEGLNLTLSDVVGVGLFGFIADGAVIADFVLRDPTVIGNGYVGGVVGRGTGLRWNTSTALGNVTPDENGNGTTLTGQAGTGPGYTVSSSDGGEGGTLATENMSPALVAKIFVNGGTITGGNASNAWEGNNAQPMGGVAGLNIFVDYAFIENGAEVKRGGSSWVGGITSCIHNGQLVFAFNSGTVNANAAGGTGTVGGVTAHTISAGTDPRAGNYMNVFDTSGANSGFNNPMVFAVFNRGTVTRESGSVPLGGVLGLHLLGELQNSLNIGGVSPTSGGNVGQLVGETKVNEGITPSFGDNFVVTGEAANIMPADPTGFVGNGVTDITTEQEIFIDNVGDFSSIAARMNNQEGQEGEANVGNLLLGTGNQPAVFDGNLEFVGFYRPGGGWVVPNL